MKRITLVMLIMLVIIAMGASEAARAVGRHTHVLDVPDDYPTIQAAIDAAYPGDKIMVGPGDYAGAFINKSVELIGHGKKTRITSGAPAFPNAGFYVQLDQGGPQDPGVSISNFTFECSMYPSMSGMLAGIIMRPLNYTNGNKAYNVDINHNDFHEGFYGIYLLNAEQCEVSHNDFVNAETPIMLWAALTDSSNNLIAHNSIQSDVQGINIGAWRNAGIWLNAIAGGIITNNQVIHNKIIRTGGSSLNPAHALFLSALAGCDIANNYIEYNDFRGSENAIGANPSDLLNQNVLSHNHGF
jgi:hypothetical protein